jgi:predicted RNA polymerase sigma factor
VREELDGEALSARSESVLRMIYVLFTEGYLPSSGDGALRLELCQEALRLAGWVAAHPRVASPDAEALLALMHLHHARRDARVDATGQPVMLEDQDRSLYRKGELGHALSLLSHASRAGLTSKYHLEAAIAAEHAFAPSFEATRWPEITQLYDRLAQVDPSPLHMLHAAVAVSYAEGPEAGIARLALLRPPTWLLGSHHWLATYADLYVRAGDRELARDYYDKAIAVAPPLERGMLIARRQRRLGGLG